MSATYHSENQGTSHRNRSGYGSHGVVLAEGQHFAGIDFGNNSPTNFYVVHDATQNLTFDYDATGQLLESYSLHSGNTAPRRAALAGSFLEAAGPPRRPDYFARDGRN